jgi:quinoprotein glucose dehydrogenase
MRILSFLLLLFTGLAMLVPGLYLAALGGSLYYAVCGVLILVSAVLILRRRRSGVTLFGLVFLATMVWSVWEVGFDGWALMPRLVYLAVAGLWLLPLAGPAARRAALAALLLSVLGSAALMLSPPNRGVIANLAPAGTPAPAAAGSGEWSHYGNTLHGTRYSELAQITPANARNLEQAWIYHAGLHSQGRTAHRHLYEVTPLMVDGTLYGCTAYSAVFALDPVTASRLWRHETKIDISRRRPRSVPRRRFFRAPAGTRECPTRILVGTVNNRLIALDAKNRPALPQLRQPWAVNLGEGVGWKFPPRLDQSHLAADHRAWHSGDRRLHRRRPVHPCAARRHSRL